MSKEKPPETPAGPPEQAERIERTEQNKGTGGAGLGKTVIEDGSGPAVVDRRRLFIISCLVAIAFFMGMLDSTILNTALPAIARSIGESPLRMQSVVIAYMITVALLIPASGWLADRFGAKKVFFVSIAIFCFGSCLCAMAWSLHTLVAARVIQGVGGAIMAPVGRLVIIRLVSRDNLVRVMSFITIPGLLGPLVGPAVGGFLVDYVSWHWIFLINVPVGVVGCVLTVIYMPSLAVHKSMRFDWSGFALFGLAMVSVAVAVEGMDSLHLPAHVLPVLWLLGAGGLFLYCLHARRYDHPLFRLGLFRNRPFTIGIVGNLISRLGSGAMPFLLPLLLQVGLGYSPTAAGLIMIPSALGAMISKSFANGTVKRFGFRRVLVVNTLLLGAMIMSFASVNENTNYYFLLAHLLVLGMVNSLQFTVMNTATIIDVPQDDVSASNSLFSVVMQLSLSFGVSCGAILLGVFGPEVTQQLIPAAQSVPSGEDAHAIAAGATALPEVTRAFRNTFLCMGVFSVFASLTFFFMPKNLGLGKVQGRGGVESEPE